MDITSSDHVQKRLTALLGLERQKRQKFKVKQVQKKEIQEFKQSKNKNLRQNDLLGVKSDEKVGMSMDNSY